MIVHTAGATDCSLAGCCESRIRDWAKDCECGQCSTARCQQLLVVMQFRLRVVTFAIVVSGLCSDDKDFTGGLNVMSFLLDRTLYRPIHKQTALARSNKRNQAFRAQISQLSREERQLERQLTETHEKLVAVKSKLESEDAALQRSQRRGWWSGGAEGEKKSEEEQP